MDFSPLSDADIQKMLATIGVESIEELFADIPKDIKHPELKIGKGLSEFETFQYLKSLAKENHVFDAHFCGAGNYYHYIPPVVNQISERSEFYTSYTPYQAEKSQGFLQAIFEYQTAICNLTQMDATNASVYDGATAIAESIIMAKSITRKNKILVIQPIQPDYRKVLETYSFSTDFEIEYADLDTFEELIDPKETAAVVFQNPNFFGELLDVESIVSKIKAKSQRAVIIYAVVESTSLGILKRPGGLGVDIICGEGQPLGLPMNFGGPGLGFITTTKRYLRKLPGRIVGKTNEMFGDGEGYILTLQAREQHIRRELALSNICSNEALCMLSVLLYLVAMGYNGLRNVAEINLKNSYYLKTTLAKIKNIKVINEEIPTYNEFLIECSKDFYTQLADNCIAKNLCPPLHLNEEMLNLISTGLSRKFDPSKDYILICNTEMNNEEQINEFINIMKNVSASSINGGDKQNAA